MPALRSTNVCRLADGAGVVAGAQGKTRQASAVIFQLDQLSSMDQKKRSFPAFSWRVSHRGIRNS
jgi:hypothetical protein